MKYFQQISFFCEIFFLLGLISYLVLLSLNIIEKVEKEKNWLHSPKIYRRILDVIARVFLIILAGSLAYYSLLPRIMDIPRFVTGNYDYIEGYATVTSGDKPYENVYIGQTEAKFFMSAGIKDGVYRIGYLPHSHRGMYIEIADKTTPPEHREIKVPGIVIFIILYSIVVVGFLNRFAYWFFGAASVLFYSVSLYFYVYYGRTKGLWFSFNNDGLTNIVFGLSLAIMLIIVYFFEGFLYRRKINREGVILDAPPEKNLTKHTSQLLPIAYLFAILSLLNIEL